MPQAECQTQAQHALLQEFARLLLGIRSAEQVIGRKTALGYWISTIVNDATDDDRYAVYDREWKLMDHHPDEEFDFHVTDRKGRHLSELLTIDAGIQGLCRCFL